MSDKRVFVSTVFSGISRNWSGHDEDFEEVVKLMLSRMESDQTQRRQLEIIEVTVVRRTLLTPEVIRRDDQENTNDG